MNEKKDKNDRIGKLIGFFKSMKAGRPASKEPDYSSWNQTEEEYQKQQAEWLAEVEKRKKKKAAKNKPCRSNR
jgi:hypothetical protein